MVSRGKAQEGESMGKCRMDWDRTEDHPLLPRTPPALPWFIGDWMREKRDLRGWEIDGDGGIIIINWFFIFRFQVAGELFPIFLTIWANIMWRGEEERGRRGGMETDQEEYEEDRTDPGSGGRVWIRVTDPTDPLIPSWRHKWMGLFVHQK